MDTERVKQLTESVTNKEQAYIFLRQALRTHYPVAVWRLPQTSLIQALIDLRPEKTIHYELEKLNKCFLINRYQDSHPVDPMILKGHILLEIAAEEATLEIDPTVTADELEAFYAHLNTPQTYTAPVTSFQDHYLDYAGNVREVVEKIKRGDVEKVVLSRYRNFDLCEDFDPLETFSQLTQAYPNAFCHLTQTTTYGMWIGASPEKLISVDEDRYFSTDALAGTQQQGDLELRDVAWKDKEIEEQAMVCRYIISCFKKIRLREYEEIGPRTAKAGNLVHLKTSYLVDMEATRHPLLAGTMLDLLHPTSAVCGFPRNLADKLIKMHEGYDRSLYAGFVGPVGFKGSTKLFVNLRCMQVAGLTARLFAGAGITADSDPDKELAETDHKMQTLLKVLQS